MKKDDSKPQFSKLRAMLFPVYAFELKKVIPMGLIFFFILFNYTCLRNVKDTLVVNSTGAETLYFLKTFCVTPGAIIFMILYVKASNIFSKEMLFYVTLSPFIIFFGAFAFVLYPNLSYIHPSTETIQYLRNLPIFQPSYMKFFQFFIGMFENWTFSLFYVLSEIWGSAILSLLFWQFANQITKIPEAKRFYALFALMGQFSLLLAGQLGRHFSKVNENLPEGADPWGYSMYWLMGTVFVFGVLTMLIYRWMHIAVLTDKRFYDPEEMKGMPKKKKPKMNLTESFKTILSSPYLLLIAVLVIAYGTTINWVEGLWKSRLEIQFQGNKNLYNIFMSDFTTYTGYATILMMFVGGNILRLFSWTTAAIITPILMLIGGVLFFSFVLFSDQQWIVHIVNLVGSSPLAMAILMGAIIIIATKSTKYALFDLTKEMAYIPLDDELKVKGKAAVDVVGGRLGKSTGAATQVLLISVFGIANAAPGFNFLKIAPIIAVLFIVASILWIISVVSLGKRVEAKRRETGN